MSERIPFNSVALEYDTVRKVSERIPFNSVALEYDTVIKYLYRKKR